MNKMNKKMNVKKIKGIFGVLLLCLILSGGSVLVYAYNTNSGYQKNPKIDTSITSSNYVGCSASYALTASASKTKGSALKTYFNNFGSLSNDFKSDSNRTLTVYLYEDDVLSDDLVKTYKCTFSGRTLKSVSLYKTNTSGTVENSSKCECYISCALSYNKGDDSDAVVTKGSLFKFDIRVN